MEAEIIIWLLLIQFTVAQHEQSERIGSPNDLQANEIPDAADLFYAIHTPTSNIAHIHQVSRSFLSVTKELLSFTPRASRGTMRENIARRLTRMKRLNAEHVSQVLHDRGIMTPTSSGIHCDIHTHGYRTMDSRCNNLVNPCWGKAEEPYQRWLSPDYANGVDAPRIGFDGFGLPPPRVISQIVLSEFHPNTRTTIPHLTNLLVTWGQLLAHDMVLTPTASIKRMVNFQMVDERLECCETPILHEDCMELRAHPGDSAYKVGHCMNFVRSVAYSHRSSSCSPLTLGQKREQVNQLTSFIDASVVYGSSDAEMLSLRENGGRGAKLEITEQFGRQYLPKRNDICKATRSNCDKRCFLAGEKRANENPALAALHTLLVRQHNRLVDRLRPKGWDNETLYHVARKIVGAQFQHITYNEFLPHVLGESLMSHLKLNVPSSEYKYDHTLNPSIYNSFATAAFRYGHSMLSARQKRRGRRLIGSPVLSQDFFSLDDFCDTSTDSVAKLLAGQAEQGAQRVDSIFTKEVTDHLFAKAPHEPGMDLYAINVQRGRDHGIPSYNNWREACGLRKANDYSELKTQIPDVIVSKLEQAYHPGRVDDIDLYVGGIAEVPVNGGILGPTFTCIIANQFKNLKFGDRFWYENLRHPGAFTPGQLNEIRKTTLASLVCENSDAGRIQSHVFMLEEPHNRQSFCDSIIRRHGMSLAAWS